MQEEAADVSTTRSRFNNTSPNGRSPFVVWRERVHGYTEAIRRLPLITRGVNNANSAAPLQRVSRPGRPW